MFHLKSYEKAESIDHALELLQQNPAARPIAGGTDVLIRLREGKKEFQHLVDIHDLGVLKECKLLEDKTLYIGSGVTFSELIHSEPVHELVPILSTAAATVGGPQVRNVATVGGNICNGVTSADSASALMVLNAVLLIRGPGGDRRIPISDFYLGPGKVDLQTGEILEAFLIAPQDYKQTHGHYIKFAMRKAMDIATIGAAAACRVEENHLMDLRLAFGVAAPVPVRCHTVEKAVRGKPITAALLKEIQDLVEADATPRTSWRASKEFRLQIIRELSRRVVVEIIEKAGGKLQ